MWVIGVILQGSRGYLLEMGPQPTCLRLNQPISVIDFEVQAEDKHLLGTAHIFQLANGTEQLVAWGKESGVVEVAGRKGDQICFKSPGKANVSFYFEHYSEREHVVGSDINQFEYYLSQIEKSLQKTYFWMQTVYSRRLIERRTIQRDQALLKWVAGGKGLAVLLAALLQVFLVRRLLSSQNSFLRV